MADTVLPDMGHDAWNERSDSEVGFWDRWIAEDGYKWPKDFIRRTDPQAPLTPQLANLVDKIDLARPGHIDILDIGAGPLSYVGLQHPGHTIDLTVADPLAERYNRLLDDKGITGVPRPVEGYFETALAQFGPERFDMIWCCNSLDHSLDPVLGLANLLGVCRTGGVLLLSFHPDEAEQGNYKGLHQWNLHARDERIWLTQKDREFCLSRLIDPHNVIFRMGMAKNNTRKERIVLGIRKMADVNISQAVLD